LFNAAKITWDGWLTACCFDHDEKFKIANLNEVDLLSAWHDEKFKKLRKKHLNNNIHVNDLCFKCLKG
jgi:radical SAM protein with 4Fe4S-binding SPASM domain